MESFDNVQVPSLNYLSKNCAQSKLTIANSVFSFLLESDPSFHSSLINSGYHMSASFYTFKLCLSSK